MGINPEITKYLSTIDYIWVYQLIEEIKIRVKSLKKKIKELHISQMFMQVNLSENRQHG